MMHKIIYILIVITSLILSVEYSFAEDSQGIESKKKTENIRLKYQIRKHSLSIEKSENNETDDTNENSKNTSTDSQSDSEIESLLSELSELNFPGDIQDSKEQDKTPENDIEGQPNSIDPNSIDTDVKPSDKKITADETQAVSFLEKFTELDSKGIDQLMEMLPDDDRDIKHPETIAHALYMAGHQYKASRFYRLALQRLDKNNLDYEAQRAWYLFQLGNSYRTADFEESMKYYAQLTEEYPNSPWNDFAKKESEIAQVMIENSSIKAIEESKYK